MLKAIVFDFDGTLVDTLRLFLSDINQVAEEVGHAPFTEKDVLIFRRLGTKEFATKKLKLPLSKIPYYVRRVQANIRKKKGKIRFFPGIKHLLRKLSRKYKIIILTSTPGDIVRGVLKKENVGCVDAIFSGSSLFGKHLIIKKLLKKHNLRRDEIIYVGDEIRDVEACKKVGVKIISVSYGFTSKSRLRKESPDYLANSPAEIGRIISKI